MQSVISHQAAAAGRLYEVLAQLDDGNVFISPFSISTALAMLYAGADGNTAQQMRQALALPDDAASLHNDYGKVLTKFQNPPNVTLNTANNIYVQHSYQVLDSYTDLLKTQYLSELKTVDFADAAGTSRLINSDVESATKGNIKNLIDPGCLSSDVRVVLTNAIYFKGSWKQMFDKKETEKRDFFVTAGDSVKTDMMNMRGKMFNCCHVQELSCKALEMPYDGDRFNMLLLLPDDKDGLKSLEKNMPELSIHQIRGGLCKRKTIITVPKFKLETSYDLIGPLKRLGISDVFDGCADLSKISGTKDLYVSKVVHKAFVEVNEEGAEAAAATAVVLRKKRCLPIADDGPFMFVADHPFFFALVDSGTGLTLFSGRYTRPA